MRTKVVFSLDVPLCCSSDLFDSDRSSSCACPRAPLDKQSMSIASLFEDNVTDIPKDFPRRILKASLSGAAPKLAVRLMPDGTYSNTASDTEYQVAYENAEDLAQHLKTYALRKEQENPGWTREFNLERVKKGVESKIRTGVWDLEPAELEWVMRRVVELLA